MDAVCQNKRIDSALDDTYCSRIMVTYYEPDESCLGFIASGPDDSCDPEFSC